MSGAGEPEEMTDPGQGPDSGTGPGTDGGSGGGGGYTYGVSGWKQIETPPTGGPALPYGNPVTAMLPDVTPAALNEPTLTMLGTIVADFIPQTSSGGSPQPSSTFGPINVALATVRSGAQTILDQVTALVTEYEELVQTTNTDLTTAGYFGQEATATVFEPVAASAFTGEQPTITQETYGQNSPIIATIPDVLVQLMARDALEGGPNGPGLVSDMSTALNGASSALEAIGQFIVALGNAGDAYASADSASAVSD
jgi:hypothetical protein